MITTKVEFEVVVELYKELKAFGNGLHCDHEMNICACGLLPLLKKARRMIEKSAIYLGYTYVNHNIKNICNKKEKAHTKKSKQTIRTSKRRNQESQSTYSLQ